ncbi:MAG: YraN family protein [Ferruginibacter sp.]
MAAHNEKGKVGEQLAAYYFLNLGYEILHQNWRHRRWEVDIIATKDQMLHFIEVKCRSTDRYGFPEEGVSLKKIKHLIDASAEFLYQFPQWKRVQFDVLAITQLSNDEAEYYLIEDVYL